jgi:hypothetical protein
VGSQKEQPKVSPISIDPEVQKRLEELAKREQELARKEQELNRREKADQ